jgi:hypothetical protein
MDSDPLSYVPVYELLTPVAVAHADGTVTRSAR